MPQQVVVFAIATNVLHVSLSCRLPALFVLGIRQRIFDHDKSALSAAQSFMRLFRASSRGWVVVIDIPSEIAIEDSLNISGWQSTIPPHGFTLCSKVFVVSAFLIARPLDYIHRFISLCIMGKSEA